MTTSNTPADTSLSSQIYLSRDNIRTQIIEYLQYYLEIENVNLVKSSFLSFLIDTIATLTSNLLFYSSSTYKEFFLTKSQLPESIYNLSAFLGYNSSEAKYATANILFTFPLTFDTGEMPITIVLSDPDNPDESKRREFKAKTIAGIEFSTFYKTTIIINSNSNIKVTLVEDSTKTYNLPVVIDSTSAEQSFSFLLPMRQYQKVTQEFQIDSDVEVYQFITIDVPLPGKVSTMSVTVTPPGSTSPVIYTEFESLYLMSSTDRGYVSRTISNGRRLTFGNGLIGVQPAGGSTVVVVAEITEGADGNVISASIKTGSKIYTQGTSKAVNYSIINPSPADGGEDEESVEEIRSNSIANLVALHRLVSEYDYKHAGVVMADTPIANNTIPVLKRSDVKCNEIQLYSVVEFGSSTRTDATTGQVVTENAVVPTRNAKLAVPITTTYLPRETIIPIGNYDYYTLFDINVDLINASAYYKYIMYQIEEVPVLVSSNTAIIYDFVCTNLKVYKSGNSAVFEVYYSSEEPDFSLCSATLELVDTSLTYPMVNDYVNKKFIYTFSDYTQFPEGSTKLQFSINNSIPEFVSSYSAEVTFRKSLDDFMMSNISIDSTAGLTIIYDIPVIEKTYYDSISKKDFELTVLQNMMDAMDFKNYRMLTDFTNLKFSNTIGTMYDMKYNPVTKSDCIDIGIIVPPSSPSLGDRYIIGYTDSGVWANKNGQIAQCTSPIGPTWNYFDPITDDIIYVINKLKKFIYNGSKWVLMEYNIPLEIEVEVFKAADYYGSDTTLANLVKSTLLNEYSSRFSPNTTLYKSELIKTIQGVSGVGHCNLIKPESNIFFEYDLQTLTEDELLEYSPEYIYFTENSISVRIYS